MHTHEQYMQRCINLALKGMGYASPNPMVGAVLVHDDRIIGEGWHRLYGQPHAEVNCLASIQQQDMGLVQQSILYVSLEPCAHFGKTPPCADLIIDHKIPRVVIGCTDSYKEVSGKGIAKLRSAGIEVTLGILEKECRWLNRHFFTRQEQNRPYLILKWAQSDDGFIAPEQGKRVMLSNSFSQTLVQKMRSEEDAILVGYRTALLDNPKLNNRYGQGKQPLRIVIDPEQELPKDLYLLDQSQPTWVFNYRQSGQEENLRWIKINREQTIAQQVIATLTHINSIIIEGGAQTLQSFIDQDLWDEAYIIKTEATIGSGVKAPQLKNGIKSGQYNLQSDVIHIFHHEHTNRLYSNQ